MKDISKGIYLGLPLGGVLVVGVILLFFVFVPDAVIDWATGVTFLVILAVVFVVLSKAFGVHLLLKRRSLTSVGYTISDPFKITVNYDAAYKEVKKSPKKALNSFSWWNKSKAIHPTNSDFEKLAYVIVFDESLSGPETVKLIDDLGFYPAVWEDLMPKEELPEGSIHALGSKKMPTKGGYYLSPVLNAKREIQTRFFAGKSYTDDKFLVFEKVSTEQEDDDFLSH